MGLRECFPKSVVLGPIDKPLLPTDDCTLRDVSEPEAGITGVSACLCETSFCNNKQEIQTIAPIKPPITNEVPDDEPETKPVRRPPTTARPNQSQFKQAPIQLIGRRKTACPRGFDLIGGGCYKVSNERM